MSANDNDPSPVAAPEISPKQARELARICKLAAELLQAATQLELDLVTGDVRRRILERKVPSAATVARVAALMRRKGL